MNQLKKYLKDFDAILVSSRPNIAYLTSYFGFPETERECFLLITKTHKYLITDGRYSGALEKKATNFEVIETSSSGFITNDYSNILKNLRTKKVGIEENNLTVTEYKSLKKNLKNIKNLDLNNLRIIKNSQEIDNVKLACKIGDLAFNFILNKIKPGITELQVAKELEIFVKKHDAEFSFKPIVAFGHNSAIPHHQGGNTKLKSNTIILLDFGIKINNYCSDMSRTIFFGNTPAKFKRMHATVLEAQAKAIEFANGKSSMVNGKLLASDIDRVARDYIEQLGFPTIPHSVGHGIGIEVHESPHLSPNSNDKIEQGMVFSVEPGIYFPNYGGVRIEDLVMVTKNGVELISHANREIIEL